MAFIRRHRLVIAGLACLAVLGAVAVWTATRGHSASQRPGPLHGPNPSATGMVVNALGKGVTIGDWDLWNSGTQPVVIQKASLIDPTPGLKVIRWSLARNPYDQIGSDQVYPPAGVALVSLHTPIKRSDALHAAELIGGFSIPHDGHFTATGVLVSYTAGGHRHEMIADQGIALCYPLASYPTSSGGCPLPPVPIHPTTG